MPEPPSRPQIRDLLSKHPDVALELKEHKESGVYVKVRGC